MSGNDRRNRKHQARPPGGSGSRGSGRRISLRSRVRQFLRPHRRCPDEEILDDFFARNLPPDQHARIAEHLASCKKCSADFERMIEALLRILERPDEDESPDNPPAPRRRFEWVDSRRLRELLPAGSSVDSPLPEELAVLVEAAAAVELSRQLPRRQLWLLRAAPTVVGFAVALALVVGSHLPTRGREAADESIVRAERLVAARFTGGLAWAPVAIQWRRHSQDASRLRAGADRYVQAAQRRRAALDEPTAADLGAIGAIASLGGSSDSGVEALQRATAADPDSAELLSDFGAALLARAEIGDRRRLQEPAAELEDHDADLPAALEAIDRALEIAPRLPEALFNRALALERLHLRRSALAAWKAYLAADDSSSWGREARQRMAAIVVPAPPDARRIRTEIAAAADGGDREQLAHFVQTYRHLARASVQEDLLPGWGEAWLGGNVADADRQLAAAAAVADEWEAQTTNATLREAVEEVKSTSGHARVRLAEGYRHLGQASRAFADFELDTAQGAAERSLDALPASSPAFAWASLVRLACLGYRGREVNAEASFIARNSPTDLATLGRVGWIEGVLHARRGNLATALASYRRSLAAYERLEEVEFAATLHYLIAEVYGRMDAPAACWAHRRIALDRAATLTDRERAMFIYRNSAILALFEGSPRAALDFLSAALVEPDVDDPGELARTYLWRARVLHELRRQPEALRDLQRAAAWMVRAKPLQRRDLTPDLDFAHGLLAPDPATAVERLTRAFEEFRSRGLNGRLPGTLLARARAHLRAGDSIAAEADLRRGLALLDERGGSEIGQLSMLRLDGPDGLFEERIALALREGDADGAFVVAEARRTRRSRLLTRSGGDGSAESFPGDLLRPAGLRARMDADTTLLVYSWLPDAIAVWQIERAGAPVLRAIANPREVERLISAFTSDLEAGVWTAATRETATKLHAALVGPVGPAATRRLVIVPDGKLHTLPFAALIDPTTDRFLIEEREVTIAPSASAFLHSRTRRAILPVALEDALVVGDPRTEPTLFPGVRSLPGARLEAREVAALYPRRELLLGEAATRSAFLESLGKRAILHFSGHAVVNQVDPARSSLPLAEEPGQSGLLTAADIARLDLTGTRTVVLSGCETGLGRLSDGEGPLSLARAFLAAGVPDVVASLWPIADVPSAPLMTALHRRLRSGETPASALRSAQLSMLRSRDLAQRSPSVWAAFEAFGG